MGRRIDGDQDFLSSENSLPSPFQQQATYNNFGSVRHGFNVPEMRYLYPIPGRFGFTTLPILETAPSNGLTGDRAPRAPMLPAYTPNTGSQRIYSVRENNQLTTPVPSRRASHMHGVESTGKDCRPQAEVCMCNDAIRKDAPELPNLSLAINAYNRVQSYPRVPVDQLLNAPSETQSLPSITARAFRGSQIPIPNGNASSAQRHASPISMSICSGTTTSSRTIQPAFNISEERLHLLNTLYRTCQSTTAKYVHSFPRVHRRSRVARTDVRYQPYTARSTQRGRSEVKREEKKAITLMDNISKICTCIWRKARRDLIAPHREEADAILEMRNLYKWSEVVSRCMESDGLDEAGADHASDISGTEIGSPGSGFPGVKVAKAAKKICQWLGDEEAWDTCDSIMGELRDLADDDGSPEDGMRRGGSEFESIV